jgi:hypothetical protein
MRRKDDGAFEFLSKKGLSRCTADFGTRLEIKKPHSEKL